MTDRSTRSLVTRLLSIAIVAVIACCPAAADGWDTSALLITSTESAAHLQSGRRHLFESRIAAAEEDFKELARNPDGEAAALYHMSTISLLKYLIQDRPDDLEEFFTRSENFKETLDEIPDSPWRVFLGAEANLQRALAHAKSGRYVRAALASRMAYHEYSRLIDENPDFYDAYKGLGLLHLAIGSAPNSFRGVLKVLGFSGSIGQGIDELQLAADHSVFSREEAQVYLSLADVTIFRSSRAGGTTLKRLHGDYPESPLFAHLYGYYLLENRQVDAARDLFDETVTLGSRPGVLYVDYVDYYLGEVLFRSDQFAAAEASYRSYIDRHHGPALKASATLGIGLSLEMQGKRQEAVSYYASVQAARSFDIDHVARRAAIRLIESPLDSVSLTLVRAANAFDSGRYERSIELARVVLAESDDPTRKAEAHYRIGRSYQAQRIPHLALDALEKGMALEGVDADARWMPWSRYYAGLVLEGEGHLAAARHYYSAALKHPGPYDYQQGLEKSCKVALARLGNGNQSG